MVGNTRYKQIPSTKIKAWVERNFPDHKLRKNGEEYCIKNPFSGGDGYKFNINIEKAVCHDWRSDDWAGPVNSITNRRNCSFLNFVKIYLNCTYSEALRNVLGASDDVSQYLRSGHNNNAADVVPQCSVTLPPGVEKLSLSKDKQSAILIRWLQSRGYESEDIDKYDICSFGMDAYWPYYEFGELVYWQSRSMMRKIFRFPDINIIDVSGKIIGKTEGSKGDFLYGFDECEMSNYVIITESIFGQYTIRDQSLASGGAALTSNQLKKLKILNPRKGIILSPDNDSAGIKSIIQNHKILKDLSFPVYYSLPPMIEYIEDGKSKYTKDWNELFTGPKLSKPEIRKIHDDNIKSLNIININKLYSLLQ